VNHSSGFFEAESTPLMKDLTNGQNLCAKLEKGTLTSRAELAELGCPAYGRNLAVV
jgi:hypothetical protein